MKKIILTIMIVAGIMTATSARPNERSKELAAGKNIIATIQSQIRYPDFLRDKDGESFATITFRITDRGGIVIKDLNCADQDLKANLLDQVADIKINTTGLDTKGTYKVVVRFLTL